MTDRQMNNIFPQKTPQIFVDYGESDKIYLANTL